MSLGTILIPHNGGATFGRRGRSRDHGASGAPDPAPAPLIPRRI